MTFGQSSLHGTFQNSERDGRRDQAAMKIASEFQQLLNSREPPPNPNCVEQSATTPSGRSLAAGRDVASVAVGVAVCFDGSAVDEARNCPSLVALVGQVDRQHQHFERLVRREVRDLAREVRVREAPAPLVVPAPHVGELILGREVPAGRLMNGGELPVMMSRHLLRAGPS